MDVMFRNKDIIGTKLRYKETIHSHLLQDERKRTFTIYSCY